MKKICILLFLFLFIRIVYSQNNVKCIIDSTIDLTETEILNFGIEYDNKRGKLKKRGKIFNRYLNHKRFMLQIEGGEFNNLKQNIVLNWEFINSNNRMLFLNYCHPKDTSIKVRDTIKFPKIKKITLKEQKINYGLEFEPEFEILFSNGKIKLFKKNALIDFSKKYQIDIKVKKGFYTDYGTIQINDYVDNIDESFIEVHAKCIEDTFVFISPFDFGTQYYFDYSGKSGEFGRRAENGENGFKGANIKVKVRQFNDSLYVFQINSVSKKTHVF